MGRWSREALKKVISASNSLLLPLVRAIRPYKPVAKVNIDTSEDRRVVIIQFDLPHSRPWVLAMYVTAQESRPLSPRDVQRMLARLNREVARKAPPYRDVTKLILAASERARRTTVGARKVLAEALVKVVDVLEAARIIQGYLEKRVNGLMNVLNKSKSSGRLKELFDVLHSLLLSVKSLLAPAIGLGSSSPPGPPL